jgi:ABC-2 type transport system ATP-binding protein
MVSFKDVKVNYGKDFILGPISFDINTGITCLVGVNGAGKTTLFNAIVGLQKMSGKIIAPNNKQLRIGYSPQTPVAPGNASCFEYLMHIAWIYNIKKDNQKEYVFSALKNVNLLDKKDTKIKKLSGGMKQRLSIATAIVHKPDLLLLDEPTVGLDPIQRIEIRNVVKEMSKNTIVFLSTHLLEDVNSVANNIIVLKDGQISFISTLSSALQDAKSIEDAIEKYL